MYSLCEKGDKQADLSIHGGIEKVIYVYPIEHYSFWTELIIHETKKTTMLEHGAMGKTSPLKAYLNQCLC